jgi:hypothetical protein
VGSDEDSPIHALYERSKCLLPDSTKEESELSEERKVRSVLKVGIGDKPRWRLPVGVKRRQCGFALQVPRPRRSRRVKESGE